MKLINMSEDKQSFWICAISGTKRFDIKEMLLIKEGEASDHAGRNYTYVEYKVRVLIDRFGNYHTYTIWHIISKNNWYIIDPCAELLEETNKSANKYQYL
ncbi:hypothetical protein [Anaerostipes caccae]|uniref:hypothetical protein n=1 Tax=Anaerostipes caccae TaxID=105841 RepID=UPI0022E4BE7F|nr:hypothetical protein [Anaerostipes caccae]